MFFRTDLAIEANDNIKSSIEGVILEQYTKDGLDITKVKITDENAQKMLSKPIGEYITVEIPILTEDYQKFLSKAKIIGDTIKNMLPNDGSFLVAGLGNSSITADNLGPMSASKILATRHISHEIKKQIGLEDLRSVSVISPGVLGQTGIEVAEILQSITKKIKPSCIIVIDAFASSDLKRLGTTVQISNTGICPGSGVLNSRAKISYETMGVPVISIGVPTVIDTKGLFSQFSQHSDQYLNQNIENMIITVREIDLLIERASKLLSMVINLILQPDLSYSEIETLMS